MSDFQVKIQKIFIKDHSNAERLELGNIGSPDGWQVVVGKGLYHTGDLVAYIGENALVPEWVLKKYGYWNEERNKGLLAGSKGDRVKAVRLRDEFSLGICIPVADINIEGNIKHYITVHIDEQQEDYIDVQEGQDVADILGVTKYEPPIPVELAGEVYNAGTHIGVKYDIENSKNCPDVFIDGELVQCTEKIHGTFCQIVVMPLTQEYHNENHAVSVDKNGHASYIAVGSKGLGGKGLFMKHNEKNANNVYLRATRPFYEQLAGETGYGNMITVCGEVFGNGVQDMKYGFKPGEIGFRVFDVYIGKRGQGRWLEDDELTPWCEGVGIEKVPVLYRGPYSKEKMMELSQHTMSTFDKKQIMEGIVTKTIPERFVDYLGRACLKFVNEDYYIRKGGTEFN